MMYQRDRFATKLVSAFISIAMVTSLVSAPGIAWAAGSDEAAPAQDQAAEDAGESSAAAAASSSADRVNESVRIASSSDMAQSVGSEAAAADDSDVQDAAEQPAESVAPAQSTASVPVAEQGSETDVEVVSAQLSLVDDAAQTAIAYNGLTYTVNKDGATVTLTGWSGKAPAGDVRVPAQVASGEKTYAVTNICPLRGGVFANCRF